MMTLEEAMMENDNQKREKIKTPFAKMIIDGSREKPYFSILYFGPADKDFHIGYSSYYLNYVFNWLNENFEIVEDRNFAISALHPVSWEQMEKVFGAKWEEETYTTVSGRGRVIHSKKYRCSACGKSNGRAKTNFCPHCGAPITDEAVQMVMERLEALYEKT